MPAPSELPTNGIELETQATQIQQSRIDGRFGRGTVGLAYAFRLQRGWEDRSVGSLLG